MTNYDLVEQKEVRLQSRRVMKNLLVFCVSFFLQYAALTSLSNLQSTINYQDNLGVKSMLASWILNPITGLLMPNLLLKFFNYKWIIVFCQFCQMAYVVANIFPSYFTLMPASALIGFSAAILWTFQGSLISLLASQYSKATGKPLEQVMVKFFGIFMMIFQLNQILGNSVSSLILKNRDANETSISTTTSQNLSCGIDFVAFEVAQNFQKVDRTQVNILCSVFFGFCLIGNLLVIFFLDNIKPVQRLDACQSILQTLKSMINPKNLLMLPMKANFAITVTFMMVDFSKAFITCAYGIHYVGYFFAITGISSSIYSFIIKMILKLIGRYLTLALSTAMQLLMSLYILWIWDPYSPVHFYSMFALAVAHGICESSYGVIQNTIIGTIFEPNEQNAAFSVHRVCFGLLFIVPFLYTNLLSIQMKIILLISGQAASLVSYSILELLLKRDFFS